MTQQISKILKGAGIVTLAGLISFLGQVFLSKDAFSDWCAKNFYPTNSKQDISIAQNTQNIISIKEDLSEIKRNQIKMLDIMLKRQN